jgi:rRNA maturation endonuclease Nob1
MTMLEQDITLRRGDSEVIVIPIFSGDPADDIFLTPSNFSVDYRLATAFDESSVVFEVNDSDSAVKFKPFSQTGARSAEIPNTQEVVEVTIDAATTADLTAQSLVQEAQLRDSNAGVQTTVMQGEVSLEDSISGPN